MTVSVVIPTRNRARSLERAVASVLSQTHGDLEVIVVDDASSDGTPAVVARLAEGDRRVRGVRYERQVGAARARNGGADAARGPVLAFLDDDCVWAPRKLHLQLGRLRSDRGVVYARQAIRVGGRWVVEGAAGAERNALESLLRTNYIGTPSLVLWRALFVGAGAFDLKLPRLQDWDLALRLARQTQFAFVPEILVEGGQGESGISVDREALRVAAHRMIDTHTPHLTRRQAAALHYGLAKFLLVDGVTDAARSFFLQAVRLDPLTPVHWAGVAAGLMGPVPARGIRGLRRMRRAAVAGYGTDGSNAAGAPGAAG